MLLLLSMVNFRTLRDFLIIFYSNFDHFEPPVLHKKRFCCLELDSAWLGNLGNSNEQIGSSLAC